MHIEKCTRKQVHIKQLWLIITFKKFSTLKFNYLEIIASSLAHLGIWTYKILIQVCVYND